MEPLREAKDYSWTLSLDSHFPDIASGLCLHGRPCSRSGKQEYLLTAHFPKLDLGSAVDVWNDLDFRPSWDPETVSIRELRKIDTSSVLFWPVKYAFPYSNREYLFKREKSSVTNENGEYHTITSKACQDSSVKVSGVRVAEYESRVVFYRLQGEQMGVHVYAEYYDDPKSERSKSYIEKQLVLFIRSFLTALTVEDRHGPGKSDNTPGSKEIRKVLDDSMSSAFAI